MNINYKCLLNIFFNHKLIFINTIHPLYKSKVCMLSVIIKYLKNISFRFTEVFPTFV